MAFDKFARDGLSAVGAQVDTLPEAIEIPGIVNENWRRDYQPLHSLGSVAIDRQANTITIIGSPQIITPNGAQALSNAVVSLPAATATLFIYRVATGEVSAATSMPEGSSLIAAVIPIAGGDYCIANAPFGNLSFKNNAGKPINLRWSSPRSADYGVLHSSGTITIDRQAGTITTTGAIAYLMSARGRQAVSTGQTVALPVTTITLFAYVLPSGMIAVAEDTAIPDGATMLATIVAIVGGDYSMANAPWGNLTHINASGVSTQVRYGAPAGAGTDMPLITNNGSGTISVDLAAGTVSTSAAGNIYLSYSAGIKKITNGQTVAISGFSGAANLISIWANFATGAIGAVQNGALPAGAINVAAVYNQQLTTPGLRSAFAVVDSNSYVVDHYAANVKPFVQTVTRLVLPDDMWFITGLSLPVYKHSIVCEIDPLLYTSSRLALLTGVSTDRDPIRSFEERINLLDTDLAATFQIGLSNWTNDSRFVKDIVKHTVAAASLAGKSPKIMVIGDSQSEYAMVSVLNDMLTGLGMTPTFLGTFPSTTNPKPTTGNFNAEARAGWKLRNFVGRDSTYASGTAITTAAGTSGGTTTRSQNPFLRVATSTDYTAHPERCFIYEANVLRNVTYAENGGAAGTYYIFDFAAYLTAWGVATPDIVIIAAGVNDVNTDLGAGGAGSRSYTTTEAIGFAAASLDIMVRSIKEANASIKVGVSPLPSLGNTREYLNRWVSRFAPLIEAQTAQVRSLQAALGAAAVYCIPTWAHTNQEWPFPLSAGADLSAANNSKIKTVTDPLHWQAGGTITTIGKRMVGNVWAAFVANVS